tara:strand:- start:976 stop:1854 length:879 start_codon:yes stop_codon:yes gene_type:complete
MKRSFEQKREQVLKRLKVSPEKPKGTKLELSPKQESPKEKFSVVNEYDKVNLDVTIYQKRGGAKERIPKVHKKDDGKQYNVTVSLPPFRAHWSYLTGNGNHNKGPYGPKDIKRARYTFTGYTGVPDAVKNVFPNLEQEQEKALKWIGDMCDKCMGVAYHDEETWKDATAKYDDDQSFIENAKHSCLKMKNINGSEVPALCMTRRLEGFGGTDNSLVFWRINEEGEYVQIEPKYITNGSLLSMQLVFRAFRTPGGDYGMAADIEKHVVVVYMEKGQKKEEVKTSAYPYVPFDI